VILDNLAISFLLQLNNGVWISSFNGDKMDRELLKMAAYLLDLSKAQDVRAQLHEGLHYEEVVMNYFECS